MKAGARIATQRKNPAADVEHRDIAAIARQWLVEHVQWNPQGGLMAQADNVVIVRGGPQGFVEQVTAGHHHLTVDEPVTSGGTDRGPDPYELIAAALGS